MRMLPCADVGLLVELDGSDDVVALYSALIDDLPRGVFDLVPAARTLLLRIDPSITTVAEVERVARAVRPRPEAPKAGALIEVPLTYDGPDLAEVGDLTGLGVRGVIEAHTGQDWTVAFCGFSPGFGYLVGTDDRLRVPRRTDPRVRVPAGSVALAGEYTGIYPRESPGGWRILGRTTINTWDLRRDPPALLVPGTTVRFVES